jgi:hypothetical protein
MMPLASGAGAAPGGFGSPASVGGGHGGLISSSASVGGGVGGIVGAELLLSEEGPDAKVEEFLRVLDEYRVKCEREGAYEEAGRATEQLGAMRKQEETRRIRALRNRHVAGERDGDGGGGAGCWQLGQGSSSQLARLPPEESDRRHESCLAAQRC